MSPDDTSWMEEAMEAEGPTFAADSSEPEILRYTNGPIEKGRVDAWRRGGRTLLFTMNNWGSGGLAAVTLGSSNVQKMQLQNRGAAFDESVEQNVYQIQLPSLGDLASQLIRSTLPSFRELSEAFQVGDSADTKPLSSIAEELCNTGMKVISEYDEPSDTADSRAYEGTLAAFSVFYFARCIYFRSPTMNLASSLLEWVNTFDPKPSAEDGIDVMGIGTPCQHPQYWDYVLRLVLRGLFEQAAQCLEYGRLENVEPAVRPEVEELVDLLNKAPKWSDPRQLKNLMASREQDFSSRYRQWRARVTRISRSLNVQDADLSSGLKQLCELLSGDHDAIHRLSDSWQECLVASVALQDPLTVTNQASLAVLFTETTRDPDGFPIDETSGLEKACEALIHGDVLQAIDYVSAWDTYFSALLATFFVCCDMLEDYAPPEYGCSIRQYLLLDLGSSCVAVDQLWDAALAFWVSAGEPGFERVELCIDHINIADKERVDELLKLCEDLELLRQAKTIANSWAKMQELQGNYLQAIGYYDFAANSRQIDSLNWGLVEQSLQQSRFIGADDADFMAFLASPLNMRPMVASMLAPLAMLKDYYVANSRSEHLKAASCLCALIRCDYIPSRLLPPLFSELQVLLKKKNAKIAKNDLVDCMAVLEDLGRPGETSAKISAELASSLGLLFTQILSSLYLEEA